MKNLILITGLLISLLGCFQEKKQENMNAEITADNIIEKISKQVKHYSREPVYQVYVNNSLCLYELLINDLPVGKTFKYEQRATPFHINFSILKSGKQRITLRLYPAPAEYNSGKETFSPNTKCSLLVRCFDNKNKKADGVEVAQFSLPTETRMAGERNDVEIKEFEGEGKKYYEATFYFDASVPYENEGWSNGQDLTKLDQKLLEKEVIEIYDLRKKIVEQKDFNMIAKQIYLPLKEQYISEYQTKDYIQKAWEEYVLIYENNSYKFQPFKEYNIQFFGNKKIICLRQLSQDNRLREKSALWGLYKEDDYTMADFHNLYLYLPQGKKLEDGLEVIR